MCGIYGIVQLDGAPADGSLLARMGDLTVHRGPDDSGLHTDGPVAIGMRRLSIIDLSGGHQPLSSHDGMLWLVCNGEIYNFRELRRDLESKGYRFKTGSDSEVLLHLYAEKGDDFVLHLNGMFAFALWDVRKKRLLVGRDRLGIKPLYLYTAGQRLAFSSEAKAFLGLPDFHVGLNLPAVDSFLQLGYVPAPQSVFDGVQKLPPASLLVVEDGKSTVRRYWRMPTHIDYSLSEAQWVEAVRTRIEEAVRMQMVSDVPIGAFLSGGIDSSAVVAFMAAHSDRPTKTYSIGFEGSAADAFYNELPYARRVADMFRTEHHEIVVRPDVVSLLPRLLWNMDEPVADTAFITTYLVSEFARKDVTVILSGVGGDELFGGYRRYLGNYYQAQFGRLPGFLRRPIAALGSHLPSDRHSALLNVLRLAKSFLASSELPFQERYRTYLQVFSGDALTQLLRSREYAWRDAVSDSFRYADSQDSLNSMLVVDAETQLPDDLLMLTDKMSMAVSLECRVPLLDQELVELAARMPESIKIKHGKLKHILKASLADVLPEDILHRKKRGFGTPMGAWLKRELAPMLHQLLSPAAVKARGLFNPAAVSRLITDHETNRIDGTDQLLALLNLEVWSRIYLDRREAADVTEELKLAA